MRPLICFLLLLLASQVLHGGEVEIVSAEAEREGDGYRFHVTLRHADSGWEHYANVWRVLGPDGTLLGERILYHPHVDEQPFTRSLSGVRIPPGTDYVEIEAGDSVHGASPGRWRLGLTR
ncbi:MAG: hypothetical protein OQL28_12900 [Sedimenticola sp.]|nr:hypothetical protein [Sedimenticola sp.]